MGWVVNDLARQIPAPEIAGSPFMAFLEIPLRGGIRTPIDVSGGTSELYRGLKTVADSCLNLNWLMSGVEPHIVTGPIRD